ncbi:hypothetical protein HGRIS_000793 [Hohenbuehelia grisea]|uniref:Adenylate kinase n=1 Tax=Hohenbuehelia grisea TaxID=104357 RepID=A0ABR3IPR5_9AGAR
MQQGDLSGKPRVLHGDANGQYRVSINGNSGVGKSTTGAALATLLGVPFISLDRLFWNPGWVQSSPEEFTAKLRKALEAAPNGWVVDGNYNSKGATFVQHEATDIIWLDPPFWRYFPRLLWRTFLRLARVGQPCSPGCDESFREVFFSKDSIIWVAITHHRPMQARMRDKMRDDDLGKKIRRLGGGKAEFRAWWAAVENQVGRESPFFL